MKAIQLEKPQHFRRIEMPEPNPPGPGEALVQVHRVGICGTDYSGYLGKMPFYSYPRIPGHELGVEVVAVANYLCSRAGATSLGVHNVAAPPDEIYAHLGLDQVTLAIIWDELASSLEKAASLACLNSRASDSASSLPPPGLRSSR